MDPHEARPLDPGSLKRFLLEMTEERSVDSLLALIVERLAGFAETALARVWLLRPGDICDDCPMQSECPGKIDCLHLVASAGRSKAEPGVEWTGLSGKFKRFPPGVRKVGHIAATGESVEVCDVAQDSTWLADKEWARREDVRSLLGQPLVFGGEVLGVLALFGRNVLCDDTTFWLRMVADHAAAAIANARAFEEIERLRHQLEIENEYLREEVLEARAFGDIVGNSAALRAIGQQIELVAPTDASVLILGESGTGKELVASEIHKRSARADRPLVRVNCASVPAELYESEFFGHAKGAFTGALKDRIGRFELAHGGTLFLDEVGEIPVPLQSKLLRVLQEGQYERVGDERTREADVRIIAATNRDLKKEVDAGRFRQDLYYRLNVFPIEVVPLRERKEDVPALATHFLELGSRKLGRPVPPLTQAGVLALQFYDWPGNVRELQNVIERALITRTTGPLRFDLPESDSARPPVSEPQPGFAVVPESEMKRRERANILAALEQTSWRISGEIGAAALLGIKPTTLSSRIKKLGIRKRD